MDSISRIIALSNAFGPSGCEDEVSEFVANELKALHPQVDHMRNVIVASETKGIKVMLDAHLDEVGLIVQAILDNGTLRILPLGGIQPNATIANSFLVRSDSGKKIPGVVASIPPHFLTPQQKNATLTFDDLLLDVGTTSKKETEALGIHIGSFVCPNVTCTYDKERDLFFGKAFDCRIGVAAEMEVTERLREKTYPNQVFASFSVQEEVGERGVLSNARKIEPDVMICFEGCPADDTFSPSYMIQSAIGKGPMLRHFDRSMITNHRFQKLALDTARENNIPVQESVRVGGGTNAAAVNTYFGTPAIVIGIPVRYIHSSYCYVKKHDYDCAVELCLKIIEKLTPETLSVL